MVVTYSADEVMQKGLRLVGCSKSRQQRVQRKTNLDRFQSHFGAPPIVCADIWLDLQTTPNLNARIDTTKQAVTIKQFLCALHFLKRHPTEEERSAQFKKSKRHLRDWGWYFVTRIAALKRMKVRQSVHMNWSRELFVSHHS